MPVLVSCGPGLEGVLPDDPTEEPLAMTETPNSNSQNTLPDTITNPVADPLPTEDANSSVQNEFNTQQKFQAPAYTLDQERHILGKYQHIDPKQLIRDDLLKKLILAFHFNSKIIQNKKYVTAIDFAKRSNEKRMFIIDVSSGAVSAYHMAHGKGSDPGHDGYAEKFSNVEGSNASSLGFYYVSETYNGSNGLSIRLDGLSSTNSNARRRAVVIHGSDYVQNRNVIQGRSYGCPAVAREFVNVITPLIKNNSLMLALN